MGLLVLFVKDWLGWLLEEEFQIDGDVIEKAVVVVWVIWSEKNRVIYGNADRVLDKIGEMLFFLCRVINDCK